MEPLTYIDTPFSEKFGTPKQSLLIHEAWGKMTFPKSDFFTEAFRGIDKSSHLWLIFEFHQVSESNIKALVRPPRFNGKEKWGVFATRSPHRPNRLGLSVVKFEKLVVGANEIELWVSGVDLVSGTPILDIKPYVPYVDRVDSAKSEVFNGPGMTLVIWKIEAVLSLQEKSLIEKVVGLDPRPGHEKKNQEDYGISVGGFNIKFRMENGAFEIFECTKVEASLYKSHPVKT